MHLQHLRYTSGFCPCTVPFVFGCMAVHIFFPPLVTADCTGWLCFPHCSLLCNNRLFFFILPYPIQIYPRTVSIHFRLVLCLYSEQIKHFMLYTVNTAQLPVDSCSPGKYLCNYVLPPCQFLKYALSNVPPAPGHLTDFRQQLSCQ